MTLDNQNGSGDNQNGTGDSGQRRAEIHVRGAKKSFSGRTVVDIDELILGDQPIEGLLGPNGAGKTTLMRMIMHSIPLDEGTVTLHKPDGSVVTLSELPAHQMVANGVVKSTQVVSDFDQLTILDSMLLALASPAYESPLRWRAERELAKVHEEEIRLQLDRFGFGDPYEVAGSAGEKKLLDIVRCLLLKPDVLLLDEPTAGLPDDITKLVMDAVRELAAGGTSVVIVEHDLEVIWELCDEVAFMAEGRLLMKGDPETIRNDSTVVEKYLGADHA